MIQVVTVYITLFFFSSRRRHTRCALVTGVQTCALPIWLRLATHLHGHDAVGADRDALRAGRDLDTRLQRITAGRDDLALAVTSSGYPLKPRSEEHTSELQSLMRSSYAVFCLKKKNLTL